MIFIFKSEDFLHVAVSEKIQSFGTWAQSLHLWIIPADLKESCRKDVSLVLVTLAACLAQCVLVTWEASEEEERDVEGKKLSWNA